MYRMVVKKDVFSGPSPVFPASTNTSIGAKAPAFAGACTYTTTRTEYQQVSQYIYIHVP